MQGEFDEGKKYPAILFVHLSGGVKEQTDGIYAGHMAEKELVLINGAGKIQVPKSIDFIYDIIVKEY